MDPADHATEIEMQGRDQALAAQREAASIAPQPFEIEGRRVCLDCFEPINKRRLKANPAAVRCTEDQALYERLNRSAHGVA